MLILYCLLHFLLKWCCSTFEICVDYERACLLKFCVLKFEKGSGIWKEEYLITPVDSFTKGLVIGECFFRKVVAKTGFTKPDFIFAVGEIPQKCIEVCDERIVLIPIEQVHLSIVLFLGNKHGVSTSPVFIEERENINSKMKFVFDFFNELWLHRVLEAIKTESRQMWLITIRPVAVFALNQEGV